MRNRRRDRARDEMPDVDGKVHRCAPRQYCGISRDAMLRFNLAIKILSSISFCRPVRAIVKIRFRSQPLPERGPAYTIPYTRGGEAHFASGQHARQKRPRSLLRTVHNCFCNCRWVIKVSKSSCSTAGVSRAAGKRKKEPSSPSNLRHVSTRSPFLYYSRLPATQPGAFVTKPRNYWSRTHT